MSRRAGARGGDRTRANGAMLVIISGPSGVGKDTIIDALQLRDHEPEYHYVVTCTTRPMRPGEVDGVDYLFLDRETFAAQRAAGEFLEANEVHGNWYGTPRRQVREALAADATSSSRSTSRAPRSSRRRSRGAARSSSSRRRSRTSSSGCAAGATETADELELRQRNAAIELARQEDYDYVVTNETGQVERTAERIDEIIAAEHARHPDRQVEVYPRSP